MSAVEIYHDENAGQTAIGLKINRTDISVAELLQAWQPLSDDEGIYKRYGVNNHSPCKGCVQNCCANPYVIPDLVAFKKMAQCCQMEHQDFVKEYFDRMKVGIGILKMKAEPCSFLKDNVCSIYPIRALICRFYVCSALSADTEQLIYSIAWMGSTATQVFAEENGLVKEPVNMGMTSMDKLFLHYIEEYRHKPTLQYFLKAEEYADIPLEPFL